MYAVPKPGSTELRLVVDHSAGPFSLNSMIHHDSVTGFPLNNLTHLGEMLIQEHNTCNLPDGLVVWKSDIADAYRLCPMHPHWQIKQAVQIGGQYYIDRCNVIGSSASGAIFIAVNSLIAWIAKNKRGIRRLASYVDDSFGLALRDDEEVYPPYGKPFPSPQARLLHLWDDLGVPHKERKQLSGSPLTIIGISVDPNQMAYTLPQDAHDRLTSELRTWATPRGFRAPVHRWQQTAGWINWALNVFPLLRPALNNFYPKISGRTNANQKVWMNNTIREDFTWALNILAKSDGVLLLKSLDWSTNDATVTIYCDACPTGMGFWYPDLHLGFYAATPPDVDAEFIFYFEALCVLCALRDACRHSPPNGRLVLYTDNHNCVDMFNTLRALPEHNLLLRAAIDLLTDNHHVMRVLHVPGTENQVADALSRRDFARAIELDPELVINPFEPYRLLRQDKSLSLQPPRDTLGAFGL